MLEVSGVRVSYAAGTPPALADVSLAVAAGECVALIGPSGSGKTTLLRSLNATVPVSAGTIAVDGDRVDLARGTALRRLRGRIGVIAQQHDLIDRLSVLQNVMAGALGRWSTLHALRFLVLPRADEVAEARHALESVGIAAKLRAPASGLSGGEQQRVAIARALVQRPALLLADEPIASLDPTLGEQIVRLLCGLARERGMALVCSLHQIELAERIFDRVIELRHGRIVGERRRTTPVALADAR